MSTSSNGSTWIEKLEALAKRERWCDAWKHYTEDSSSAEEWLLVYSAMQDFYADDGWDEDIENPPLGLPWSYMLEALLPDVDGPAFWIAMTDEVVRLNIADAIIASPEWKAWFGTGGPS